MQTKLLVLLFCFMLLLALCGCRDSQGTAVHAPSEVETASESTAPSEQTDAPIPAPYGQILADYETVIDFRLSENFEAAYNNGEGPALSEVLTAGITGDLIYRWGCMLVERVDGPEQLSKDAFGYILKDINGDGTPELFWVREDHTILAVFTVADGQARLLDAYWPRYHAVVTDTLMLYTMASGGAAYNDYKIYRLTEKGAALIPTVEFGMEGEGYYEVVDGGKTQISEAHFEELMADYPFQMSLEWEAVPITHFTAK